MSIYENIIGGNKKKEEEKKNNSIYENIVSNKIYTLPSVINTKEQQKEENKKTKKKSILDNALDFGKSVINLPSNIVKSGVSAGKTAVEKIPEAVVNIDAFRRMPTSKKAETLGSTALSTTQIFGEGALHRMEGLYDWAADKTGGISDRINTKLEKAVGLHKGKSEKEVNEEKNRSRQEMIKTDYTGELMKAVGKEDYKDLIESKSLVKEDNLAGQIVSELGGQSVNLLLTNDISKGMIPTEVAESSKLAKLYNLGVQSTPIYTTSYGQALQEAYQNGATQSEARRYAAGSAATETMTEWITSGIPGVKGTKGKGLDKWFEKLIGEELEQPSKTLSKALLKSGYKLAGESTEEVLSDIINPYLKQFTYEYNNQKDALGNFAEASSKLPSKEDLLKTIIVTCITTGILEAPSSISDISNTVKNKNNINTNIDGISHTNNTIRNNENINKNEVNKNEKEQNSINIPVTEENAQNDLKLPINKEINNVENKTLNLPTVEQTENANPLESLEQFKAKQQEIINQQEITKNQLLQQQTNERINTLEEQLEKQGTRILEESEAQKQAMIESFKEYLEEHNITNPTQEDINDSITDIMSYDNDLDFADTAKAEQLYNKYVKEYMQENGIPFNNENKIIQPLNKRVSGNQLLDAQDLIDEVKSVGAKVDDNGYITVYHQTTPEAAQEIRNTGKMISNEPYVYFSTSENASQADGRGQVKLEFRIPAESLILDDIFSDNADVKIKLNGKNLDVSNYIVNNQPSIPTARDFNKVNLPSVEKNDNMVYNVNDPEYIGLVSAIPQIKDYSKYSMLKKWLDKPINELKRVSRMLANDAIIKKNMGLNNSEYIDVDGKTVYDYDITGDKYIFKVKNIYEYTNEMEEIYERNVEQNSQTIISNELQGQSIESNSDVMLPNSRESRIDDRLSREKYEEWFNKKQNKGKSNRNKSNELRELENSSFSLPTKENNKTSMPMAKTDDVLRIASQNIAKQINGAGGFDLKQRSWVETATESDILKDKVYIEDLEPGKISYVVQSNKKSLDSANKHLETYGYDKTLDYVKNIMQSDKLPSASDVALMQRMIQEASKRGDAETVQDLIMDTAIVGTDLGQATQALSIIQKLTPEGQLKMYTKLVQRAKARGEKSFQNVEITPEMVQNILEAYDKNGNYDRVDLNARVEKFKQDIADQMKSTVGEKVDAWRYLSMLGNPKTHIRNMVSNIAMTGTIKVKNAMARTLETVLPVKNRTKTWKAASQDIKEYSRKTANDMKGIITGENKYNEKSAIESKKQIFKSKVLEKLSTLNGNALEGEDWFFSKRAFQNTLQEYLTANGINTYEDIESNPELVEKAKLYAVEQAEIATFRQYSKLASEINKIERKNKGARLAIQALVPFKKTPINVAKAGVNYSPLGLSKNLTYDLWQLTHGNMEASQFIDKLSQGLTGTSLTLLGYALAKAGILTGSGGDDKDDKYDKQLGKTGYSLNIGGKSYSISWLSPVAMPLLVGSNAYEQLEEQKEWDMNVVSDTLAKTLDPLNEMSFMQGLTNALNSYGSGVDKWKGALESTGQNYVGQFFPTLFSQIAATTDDKKRSTKASNNSKYKFGEQTVRSVMYKIPGLRQQLEVATDVWGNEKKQSSNIIERAFESFIAPYTKTENISTKLDEEIKRVYSETGNQKVVPGVPYAYTKYGGETYRMSANEYTKFKKTYGKTANSTLNQLIDSESYQKASNEDKAKMIENVYEYARAKANEEYFNSNNIEYSNQLLDKVNTLHNRYGINANTYFSNKKEYDYAYQNPDKYSVIKQIASYEKYTTYKDRITDIRNNTTNDKDETIKYINSLNMNIPQKAMFIKQYYKSFKSYDDQIIEYIDKQKITKKEKEQILTQLGFTVKDGRVYK